MQIIPGILLIENGSANWVADNGASNSTPVFTLGVLAGLSLDLRAPLPLDSETVSLPAYPFSELDGLGLRFVMDVDYNQATVPPLKVASGITLSQDSTGHTRIAFQLPDTNYVAMRTHLGVGERLTFKAALIGTNASGKDVFYAEFPLVFRNHIDLDDAAEEPDTEDPSWLPTVQASIREIVEDMADDLKGDPGDDGDDGAAGKSAYEIWLEAGHTGTEAEFLASLKGDTGSTGATGAPGPANSLSVGTVTTLPAGSNATVEITGTAPNQTANFGIPRGPQGAGATFAYNITSDANSANWHPTMLATDRYWRISIDNGVSWSIARPLEQASVAPVARFSKIAQATNPTWQTPTDQGDGTSLLPSNCIYFRIKVEGRPWTEPALVGIPRDATTYPGVSSVTDMTAQQLATWTATLKNDGGIRVAYAAPDETTGQQPDAEDADAWHAIIQTGDCYIRFSSLYGALRHVWTVSGGELASLQVATTGPEWHDTPLEDDKYMKLSLDGGTSWYGYFKIAMDADDLELVLDSTPTQGSSNGVTSGGVYAAIQAATGGQAVDLSNYYTKSQADTLLQTKANASHAHVPSDITGLAAAFANKQDVLPSGDAGKYLKKTANGVEWSDAPSGSASVDLSGYYTKPQADTLLASKLSAPSGGSTGQFLKKTANGVEWDTPAGGSSNYNALFDEDVVSIYEGGSSHGGSTFGQPWIDNMMLQAMCHDCAEGFTKLFVNTANGHLELIRFTHWGSFYAFDKNGHMLREPQMQGYWNLGSRFPANSALLSSSPSGLRSTLSSGNRGATSLSCEVTSANHPEADYVGTYIDETGNGTYTGPSGGVEPDGDGHYWGVAYYYTTDGTSVVRHYYDEWGETMNYPQTFGVLTPAYDEVVNEIDPSILVTLNASDNGGGGDENDNDGGGDGNDNGGGGDENDNDGGGGGGGGNDMPTGNIPGQYEIWDITDTCGCAAQWPSALARLDDLENATFAWLAVQRTSGVNKYPSGERWSIDGGTTWKTFGAVECKLLAGQYTVVFADAQNYTKPENQTIVLSAGEHRSVTTAYTATSCTLEMRYLTGVPSGAQWSLDDGSTWHDFNEEVSNITPGSYYVTYKPIQGRVAPEPQYLTLTAGSTRIVQALSYTTPTTGTVTLTFSGTVPTGAGWTIDGQTYTSGQTATLSPGTYAITYASVEGYDSPSTPTSVTVAAGDTLTLSAEYTEQQAVSSWPASFTLSTSASGLAGTWTLLEGTTTEYNGDTYPVYQNGSSYLAMRSTGKPHINSSADVSQTSLWRPDVYTQGAEMTASNLSGEWNNPNDDWDATFTFTET